MAEAEVVAAEVVAAVQAAPEVARVPQEVVPFLIHQVAQGTLRSSSTVPLTTTTATHIIILSMSVPTTVTIIVQ